MEKAKVRSSALTDKEFFVQACRFADTSTIKTAQKWWDAFVEVLIRELYYNGTCRVPKLGTFYTREVTESLQKQIGVDGKEHIYTIPARDVPCFTPHDMFINDVNMTGVTKAYRKRLKKGELTARDYERQIRAESLGVVGSLSEERIKAAQTAFQNVLRNKKRLKGTVEPEDEEN